MALEDIIGQLKPVDWILLERVGAVLLANEVPAPKLKALGLVEAVFVPHPVVDRKLERWRITELGRSALMHHNPGFAFPAEETQQT